MRFNFNFPDLLAAAEHLAGFVIVLLALTLLWGLTVLIGRFFASSAAAAVPPAGPAPAAAPATPAPAGDELTDEEIVVISAAVAAMVDGRHRVVSVQPVQSSWGQQGRREIHASHRIR